LAKILTKIDNTTNTSHTNKNKHTISAKEAHTLKVQILKKIMLKLTNCFLLLQIKKMNFGLTWVLSKQNPLQKNGKKL
jgi:hypothetical protein